LGDYNNNKEALAQNLNPKYTTKKKKKKKKGYLSINKGYRLGRKQRFSYIVIQYLQSPSAEGGLKVLNQIEFTAINFST
jgi:peptide deformylase